MSIEKESSSLPADNLSASRKKELDYLDSVRMLALKSKPKMQNASTERKAYVQMCFGRCLKNMVYPSLDNYIALLSKEELNSLSDADWAN